MVEAGAKGRCRERHNGQDGGGPEATRKGMQTNENRKEPGGNRNGARREARGMDRDPKVSEMGPKWEPKRFKRNQKGCQGNEKGCWMGGKRESKSDAKG